MPSFPILFPTLAVFAPPIWQHCYICLTSIAFVPRGTNRQVCVPVNFARVTFQSSPVLLQLLDDHISRKTQAASAAPQPVMNSFVGRGWGGGGRWMTAFLNCLPLIIARRHHLKWRRWDKISWRNEIEKKSGCVLIWGGIPGRLPRLFSLWGGMTYLCGPNTALCLCKQFLNYLHLISWRLKAEAPNRQRAQVCTAAAKHLEKKTDVKPRLFLKND